MRKKALAAAVLLCTLTVSVHSQELTIGVVEFEEKNSIGLENAGRIVAEWVVTELRQLESFQIAERLLMQQVLEEQNLMLSGVIDEEQAAGIGQLYGVDAIVSGSVMKVGAKISVTARMVNVSTGEVLKTASGSVDTLGGLEELTYILANNLSDISREEFLVREAIEEKSYHRLEIGGGVGPGWDKADYSSLHLDAHFRYQSPLFALWIEGAPLGSIQNVELGGNINPLHYLGIGAVYGRFFDNAIDYVQADYLMFGIVGRPVLNFEFGLFFGGTTGGVIWTETDNDVEVDGSWNFGGTYQVWLQYRMSEEYAVMLRVQGVELLDFGDQLPGGYQYPLSEYEYRAGKFSIIFNYSFLI
jgi:TolB-like protein